MREKKDAPVDTMGCHALADRTETPEVRKKRRKKEEGRRKKKSGTNDCCLFLFLSVLSFYFFHSDDSLSNIGWIDVVSTNKR
jgi:hypothetical protein